MNKRVAILTLAISSLLVSASVGAAVPDRPLYWAHKGFNNHSEAVESVTIRGRLPGGHNTFIRFSVANAAYKKGALTITFKQESAKGTLYAKQSWKRGRYTATSNRFGITAGANSLSVDKGALVMRFAYGTVKATVTLTPRAAPLAVRDVDGRAWMRRALIVPYGTLHVQATDTSGRQVDAKGTAFSIHEASKIKAHRTWERSVQLHHIRGGQVTLVDYIIGPKERRHRPLGFVVLRGGGVHHVGKVVGEQRGAERLDKKNDYKVPWQLKVLSERGGKKAEVAFTVSKRTSRKDDLAKLGYFTRKAVSMLIHPFTYGLKGQVQVTGQAKAADQPAPTRTVKARWTYAQAR